MGDNIRLGLIGSGGIARNRHIPGLGLLKQAGYDRFSLTAVCDVSPDSAEAAASLAGEQLGTRPTIYADWQEMLQRERLDAVDICLPHGLHHVVGIAALKAGLHVVMEKPFAITIKAGRKLVEAAEQNGRILATAVPKRRMPQQRAAWWALHQARLIGEPRAMLTQVVAYTPPVEPSRITPAMSWRRDRMMSGGGPTTDSGYHYMDSLRYFFGDVDQIYAELRSFRTEGPPAMREAIFDHREDTATAIFSFASGVVVTWTWSHALPGKNQHHSTIYGTEGCIDDTADGHRFQAYHMFERTIELRRHDGLTLADEELLQRHRESITEEEYQRLFPYGVTEHFAIELWDFLDAVEKGRRPEVDGMDGLKAQAMCEAIYESAITGKAVKLADVLEGRVARYQEDLDRHWETDHL